MRIRFNLALAGGNKKKFNKVFKNFTYKEFKLITYFFFNCRVFLYKRGT